MISSEARTLRVEAKSQRHRTLPDVVVSSSVHGIWVVACAITQMEMNLASRILGANDRYRAHRVLEEEVPLRETELFCWLRCQHFAVNRYLIRLRIHLDIRGGGIVFQIRL